MKYNFVIALWLSETLHNAETFHEASIPLFQVRAFDKGRRSFSFCPSPEIRNMVDILNWSVTVKLRVRVIHLTHFGSFRFDLDPYLDLFQLISPMSLKTDTTLVYIIDNFLTSGSTKIIWHQKNLFIYYWLCSNKSLQKQCDKYIYFKSAFHIMGFQLKSVLLFCFAWICVKVEWPAFS